MGWNSKLSRIWSGTIVSSGVAFRTNSCLLPSSPQNTWEVIIVWSVRFQHHTRTCFLCLKASKLACLQDYNIAMILACKMPQRMQEAFSLSAYPWSRLQNQFWMPQRIAEFRWHSLNSFQSPLKPRAAQSIDIIIVFVSQQILLSLSFWNQQINWAEAVTGLNTQYSNVWNRKGATPHYTGCLHIPF